MFFLGNNEIENKGGVLFISIYFIKNEVRIEYCIKKIYKKMEKQETKI